MELLFIIALVSCLSLVWAAFSIVRHVRRDRLRQERAAQGLSQSGKRSTVGTSTFAETLLRSSYDDPPVGGRVVRQHPRQDLAAGRVAAANRVDSQRRPPASEHPQQNAATGTHDSSRSDWHYYNRNMGDLSDPDANRPPQRRSNGPHTRY